MTYIYLFILFRSLQLLLLCTMPGVCLLTGKRSWYVPNSAFRPSGVPRVGISA